MTGYLSVSRFATGEPGAAADLLAADLLAAATRVLDLLAAQPGFRRGHLARGTEEPGEVLLVTEWDGAGWWRRAAGTFPVRAEAIPLLARARAEPASFEVLVSR